MGIDVGSKFIEPHVTTTDTNGVDGHTTYRLTVSTVGDQAKSIYAIYGDKGDNLSMPPCYHVRRFRLSGFSVSQLNLTASIIILRRYRHRLV